MDYKKIRAKNFLIFAVLFCFLIFSSVNAQNVNVLASVTAECGDGVDNDGDGLIDYPVDPGCSSIHDDDETDSAPEEPEERPSIIVGAGGYSGATGQKPLPPPQILKIADFNGDSRINIIDFSILLFFMNRPISEASRYDLNNDGKIDIVDISILFYYWT